MTASDAARQLHARCPVVDLHAHPSLKVALWGSKFAERHRTGGAWNPFATRVDLPKLRDGGVKALLSAVYLPERGLLDDCWLMKTASWLAPRRIKRFFKDDPFAVTLALFQEFEGEVTRSRVSGQELARVVKSVSELDAALAEGKIAILHTLEGAHSLGNDPARVRQLFDRGVCLLTLGHFYENAFIAPVDAIPPAQKLAGCFSRPKDLTKGLTPLGEQLVEQCVELGMLVDLTHGTPPARRRIVEVVNRRRPLVFSHVGVATMNPAPMNPTREEVRAVADSGGVIGIILMNFWLTTAELKQGLHLLVETARHLKDQGGIETVALGTDFDGFTDPPDDVKDMADLPNITDALLRGGFTETEIERILGGNALRVLRQGWGRI